MINKKAITAINVRLDAQRSQLDSQRTSIDGLGETLYGKYPSYSSLYGEYNDHKGLKQQVADLKMQLDAASQDVVKLAERLTKLDGGPPPEPKPKPSKWGTDVITPRDKSFWGSLPWVSFNFTPPGEINRLRADMTIGNGDLQRELREAKIELRRLRADVDGVPHFASGKNVYRVSKKGHNRQLSTQPSAFEADKVAALLNAGEA
jgi:hypothetical protein